MLRRLLNIISIVCLVACVALMGMWVRSYLHSDFIWVRLDTTRGCGVNSELGRLLWRYDDRGMIVGPTAVGSVLIIPSIESAIHPRNEFIGFGIFRFGPLKLVFPYWFAVLVSRLLASAFRRRWPWRFNVREAFMLTAFVAIVLGMSAWLDRAWIGK